MFAALLVSLVFLAPAYGQFRGGSAYEDLYDSENAAAMKVCI